MTLQNLTEPDKASSLYVKLGPQGGTEPVTCDDWASDFLSVELSGDVPEEVRVLFAVARGAMVYGWFYYPLYALGEEQIRRVADAACLHRYQGLGGPVKRNGEPPSFHERIRFLVERGVIPADREELWDGFRELRNLGSHPSFQTLIPPGWAAHSLGVVAEHVNALFAASALPPGLLDGRWTADRA